MRPLWQTAGILRVGDDLDQRVGVSVVSAALVVVAAWLRQRLERAAQRGAAQVIQPAL